MLRHAIPYQADYSLPFGISDIAGWLKTLLDSRVPDFRPLRVPSNTFLARSRVKDHWVDFSNANGVRVSETNTLPVLSRATSASWLFTSRKDLSKCV